MILNGSQIFVEVLAEQGVDTIFGYPGGAVLNLYDELYKNSDRIRHILTAHEQGASHAADGYARATGRTGVVLATSGPGATNLVTGIATAYMDSVPMVAFTGNVATSLLGRDSFQEAYIEGITMPITKHNFTVRKVEDLADTMRAAFRIAQSGRKGPVLVDIPKDVTANSCEFTHKEPELIRTVTRYNEEEVKEAARLINESERPIVYFGGGVRSAAGCQPLRDLLEKTGMPATHTLMAAGVLGYGEPHNLGMLGLHTALCQEVDLAAALRAHLGQELGSEGAILDLGQDLLHLLAGFLGDQALAGAVVAVFSGVGDGVAHLVKAALVDQVNDQLHLVAGLEVSHFRCVASFHQGVKASMDQLANAAAEHSLLAEQVGLGFLLEGGLQDACTAGTRCGLPSTCTTPRAAAF